MAPWLEPNGPLNYRQVEELIVWLTASNDVIFKHEPESHGVGEVAAEPEQVAGWRDPNWQPGPEDTPPPACWKNPSGVIGGGAPAADSRAGRPERHAGAPSRAAPPTHRA